MCSAGHIKTTSIALAIVRTVVEVAFIICSPSVAREVRCGTGSSAAFPHPVTADCKGMWFSLQRKEGVNMRHILLFVFARALSASSLTAQVHRRSDGAGVLTTVRISAPVLAAGAPLPAGTY